jgi:RNA polymerase sigma factor (sigma-70 family)
MDSLTAEPAPPVNERARTGPPAGFELLYRTEVRPVTAFFARRSGEPETVADLTAETFLEALRSYGSFDPAKGSGRSWVFAIARRVYARHCERVARQRMAASRERGRLALDGEAIEDLAERIDAEREGRELLKRIAQLPRMDREALELVDLSGLTAREAAKVLGSTSGALRVRLYRARARLRKEYRSDG